MYYAESATGSLFAFKRRRVRCVRERTALARTGDALGLWVTQSCPLVPWKDAGAFRDEGWSWRVFLHGTRRPPSAESWL